MQILRSFTVAAVALAAAGGAWAQSAGTFQFRAGLMNITPSVSSGDLSAPSPAGSKVDVTGSTQLAGGITYMLTDHIALDLPLAVPFKHDILGAGYVEGVGKLGQNQTIPASLFAQYRFGEAQAKVRPYLGGGLTYAKFTKERSTNALSAITGGTPANPTTLSVQSKLAPTILAGVVYAIDERWFVEGMVAKTFLKTRTTLSTGQTLDVRLNPTTLAFSVGYRF